MADNISLSLDLGSTKLDHQLKAIHNTLRGMDTTVATFKQSLQSLGGSSLHKQLSQAFVDARPAVSSYFDLVKQYQKEALNGYTALNKIASQAAAFGSPSTNTSATMIKDYARAAKDAAVHTATLTKQNESARKSFQDLAAQASKFGSVATNTGPNLVGQYKKAAFALHSLNQEGGKSKTIFSGVGQEFKRLFDVQSILTTGARSLTFYFHQLFASIPFGIINITKLHAEYLGFRNALAVAEGTIGAANISLQKALDIATELKLPIRVVTKEYTKFINAVRLTGYNADQATNAFYKLSTAARVLNLSQESTRGMFLALEQMVSKGTVSMEELRRQLGNALPGAVDIAALAFEKHLPAGLKTANDKIAAFIKMVKKGEVSSKKFIDTFIPFLYNRTKPFLAESLDTTAAAITALTNQWELFKVRLGEGIGYIVRPIVNIFTWLLEVFNSFSGASELFAAKQKKVYEALRETTTVVREVTASYDEAKQATITLGEKVAGLGIAFVGLTGGLAGLTVALKGLKTVAVALIKPISALLVSIPLLGGFFGTLGTRIGLTGLAIKGFMLGINPVVAVVTAIGAAVGSLVWWLETSQDEADKAARSFKALSNEFKAVKTQGDAAATTLESIVSKLKDMNGLERLGAEYVVAGLTADQLIQKQKDLALQIEATNKILQSPAAKLDNSFAALMTAQIVRMQEELKTLPALIEEAKRKQKDFQGALGVTAAAMNNEEVSAKKLKKTKVELQSVNSELADIYEILNPGLTKNADIMFKLNNLWEDGVISGETFYQVLSKINEEANKKSLPKSSSNKPEQEQDTYETYMSQLKKDGASLQSVYVNAFKSMEDAMVAFATGGEVSFRSMAQAILADLTRMIAKQMIFNALSAAFGGGGGGGSSSGLGLLSSLFGLGGASVSSVPIKFEKGTNYLPNDTIAMLHKGEAVVPAKYNPDNPASTQSADSKSDRAINIFNLTDTSMIRDYLISPDGDDIFMNFINSNPTSIRQAIG